jgi:nucleotide-binding universal stress UspA family protein
MVYALTKSNSIVKEWCQTMAYQYHRILYATDLSAASIGAIQYAINYAVKKNSTLIIFHVVDQRAIACSKILASFFNEGDGHKIRHEKVSAALKRMKTLLGICRQKELNNPFKHLNNIEYLVVHYGRIAQEIVEKTNQWGCDFIILGPRRKRLLGRLLLPSISRKVIRWTDKPVHIIKSSKKEK